MKKQYQTIQINNTIPKKTEHNITNHQIRSNLINMKYHQPNYDLYHFQNLITRQYINDVLLTFFVLSDNLSWQKIHNFTLRANHHSHLFLIKNTTVGK